MIKYRIKWCLKWSHDHPWRIKNQFYVTIIRITSFENCDHVISICAAWISSLRGTDPYNFFSLLSNFFLDFMDYFKYLNFLFGPSMKNALFLKKIKKSFLFLSCISQENLKVNPHLDIKINKDAYLCVGSLLSDLMMRKSK